MRENTVQFYLALLNIPVEYSSFDSVSMYLRGSGRFCRSIDMENWRNLLDIAQHPSQNFLSLLALFLPNSYFYTIFVQIVVNRLNKLETPDFVYLLRVLKALPVAKQFAFARFCWRMFPRFHFLR